MKRVKIVIDVVEVFINVFDGAFEVRYSSSVQRLILSMLGIK